MSLKFETEKKKKIKNKVMKLNKDFRFQGFYQALGQNRYLQNNNYIERKIRQQKREK